jgi:tRNA(Ile2) C34 agmatinyltransferase TiaS
MDKGISFKNLETASLPEVSNDGYVIFYKYRPKCLDCGTYMKMRKSNSIQCPKCKKIYDCKYVYLN